MAIPAVVLPHPTVEVTYVSDLPCVPVEVAVLLHAFEHSFGVVDVACDAVRNVGSFFEEADFITCAYFLKLKLITFKIEVDLRLVQYLVHSKWIKVLPLIQLLLKSILRQLRLRAQHLLQLLFI